MQDTIMGKEVERSDVNPRFYVCVEQIEGPEPYRVSFQVDQSVYRTKHDESTYRTKGLGFGYYKTERSMKINVNKWLKSRPPARGGA